MQKETAGRIRPKRENVNTANMNVHGVIITRFQLGRKVVTIQKNRVNEVIASAAVLLFLVALFVIVFYVFGVDDAAMRIGG